jgi:phosphoglycolate phosphatase
MSAPLLVFDLDGTLVDHRERSYGLHRDYCVARGYVPVPKAEYHARKARGESEQQSVRDAIPPAELDGYLAWKRAHIESDAALALDTVCPDIPELLARLAPRATLVVLTNRQSAAQTEKELRGLGIADRFAAILTAPNDGGAASKLAALRGYLDEAGIPASSTILIGDTEHETAVARRLGATSLSVTWGMRGLGFLETQRPDAIAQSVAELERLIHERWSHA